MKSTRPLPENFNWRTFTVNEGLEAGLSRKRLRADDLSAPVTGLRLPKGAPFNLLEKCRALTQLVPKSVISHVTAARIHGLYLPTWLDTREGTDLARPFDLTIPRRSGIRGHQLMFGPEDIVVFGGVPVTTVQRTLLDLASLLGVDDLVYMADQIVCEHHLSFGPEKYPLVSLAALEDYIAGHAGARGMKRLREAMKLVRIGSDSRPESRLRLLIERSPLPTFVTNYEIKDASDEGKVAPDLACEEYRTCTEYDGRHHFTPGQQSKDHDRDYITKDLGWHQVLINNNDMKSGEQVVITKIARMLVAGGWQDHSRLSQRSLKGLLNTRKDYS